MIRNRHNEFVTFCFMRHQISVCKAESIVRQFEDLDKLQLLSFDTFIIAEVEYWLIMLILVSEGLTGLCRRVRRHTVENSSINYVN